MIETAIKWIAITFCVVMLCSTAEDIMGMEYEHLFYPDECVCQCEPEYEA